MIKFTVAHGVRFEPRQWELIQKVVKAEGITVTILIRNAVWEYFRNRGIAVGKDVKQTRV